MRYAFKDLGEQPAGSTVVVRLQGSVANVLLLDSANYSAYRVGRPFRYAGGLFRSSPARVTVPRDGHWHLIVDLGGFRGRVRAQVERVEPPDSDSSDTERAEEHSSKARS